MAKKTPALTINERIATLKKRIAEKTNPESKVTDGRGCKIGSVKLRYKVLTDGRISFYLDVYAKGKRAYDFLNIYLYPADVANGRDIGTGNENAILEAESKRMAMVEDMAAGKDVAKKAFIRSKIRFIDWMRYYSDKKKKSGQSNSFAHSIDNTILQIIRYRGDKVTIEEIDKEYCEGFLQHLAKATSTRTGKPIAKVTQAHYYKMFRMALGEAVRKQVITENPAMQVDNDLRPKIPESTREFLDVAEIKKLIATPCAIDEVKRAYLFSCFCGLRYSDIAALRWEDIVTRNGQPRIEIKMIKTGKPLSVPLSTEALRWMTERGAASDTDKVFSLPSRGYLNSIIRTWATAAGITKHLSFHTARHTFATLELTAGADLYTTSKLLGHTNVATTQIYAKIVDRKKEEAVGMLSSLFTD